jgi:hypothetical protein
MKKINVILGIILFIAPLLLVKQGLRELEVEKNGKLVKMKIIEKPSSCLGTKVKWFMKVEYHNIIYPIQISGNYCEEHSIGDMVEIRYLEGSDIILLPSFSSKWQLFSTFSLSLIGLFAVIYYGFIKKNP